MGDSTLVKQSSNPFHVFPSVLVESRDLRVSRSPLPGWLYLSNQSIHRRMGPSSRRGGLLTG